MVRERIHALLQFFLPRFDPAEDAQRFLVLIGEQHLERGPPGPIFRIFGQLEKEGLITVVPLHPAFLSDKHSVFMSPSGQPYYRDGDHLTLEGARHAAKVIAPFLWPK